MWPGSGVYLAGTSARCNVARSRKPILKEIAFPRPRLVKAPVSGSGAGVLIPPGSAPIERRTAISPPVRRGGLRIRAVADPHRVKIKHVDIPGRRGVAPHKSGSTAVPKDISRRGRVRPIERVLVYLLGSATTQLSGAPRGVSLDVVVVHRVESDYNSAARIAIVHKLTLFALIIVECVVLHEEGVPASEVRVVGPGSVASAIVPVVVVLVHPHFDCGAGLNDAVIHHAENPVRQSDYGVLAGVIRRSVGR